MSTLLEGCIIKKSIIMLLVYVVLIFMTFTLTACANETDALRAQVELLENENATLISTISSMQTDLDRSQNDLSRTQNELQNAIIALEAFNADAQDSQQGNQSGPLAITYGGEPNKDMSWPLSYGDLVLGLRLNINEFDEDDEIIWHSTNEDVFTVVPGEDGTTAIVTPYSTGSAQLVVTIGDQETKSWVRIT